MADKKEKILEMVSPKRDRNYTQSERFRKLSDIYDNGLDFLEASSQLHIWKGTSAVISILLGVRTEVTGLPEMNSASADLAKSSHSIGWDYSQDDQNVEA